MNSSTLLVIIICIVIFSIFRKAKKKKNQRTKQYKPQKTIDSFLKPKALQDYVVLDTETTGLYPETDKIIELSMIRVRNNSPVAEYSQLFNPGKPISYNASKVNGITDEMVQDKPKIQDHKNEILDFICGDIVVGHNICFDTKFLKKELGKDFYDSVTTVDTLSLSKKLLPNRENYKLITLCREFGFADEQQHRALDDVYLTYQLFEKLMDIGKKVGLEITK